MCLKTGPYPSDAQHTEMLDKLMNAQRCAKASESSSLVDNRELSSSNSHFDEADHDAAEQKPGHEIPTEELRRDPGKNFSLGTFKQIFLIERNAPRKAQDVPKVSKAREEGVSCKICHKKFATTAQLGGHTSKVHKGCSINYKLKMSIRDNREADREALSRAR